MLGTALGFGAFVMIVLTVTQLVFRVMRVTLAEWMGDTVPLFRNMHVSSIISMGLTAALVLTGHVGLSLANVRRLEPAHGGALAPRRHGLAEIREAQPELRALPDAVHVLHDALRDVRTVRNLYVTIASNPAMSGLPVAGAWAMIIVAALLLVASLVIGWDGLKAYRKYSAAPIGKPAVAKA